MGLVKILSTTDNLLLGRNKIISNNSLGYPKTIALKILLLQKLKPKDNRAPKLLPGISHGSKFVAVQGNIGTHFE